MLELGYLIVIITLLITFWSLIKKIGTSAEKALNVGVIALDVVSETSEDSLRTYQTDIRIMNGKKRVAQMTELKSMEAIPSVEDIDAMFAGLSKKA